jgi:protein SCO1
MVTEKKNSRVVAVIIAAVLGIGIIREVSVVKNPEKNISPAQAHQLEARPVLRSATLLPTPKPLPAFHLLNENSVAVTEQTLNGQWHLLFFGYTECPDICPAMLTLLKPVMKALAPYKDTRFVFISVNPTQDTPPVLKAFLSKYDGDFMGITGDGAAISSLLTSLNLYAAKEGQTLAHSSTLLLLNPKGELVSLFSKPETADDIIHDVEVLQGKKK